MNMSIGGNWNIDVLRRFSGNVLYIKSIDYRFLLNELVTRVSVLFVNEEE